MNKLIDVFDTKYFADHHAGEVSIYLASVGEIDIADARICASVMEAIQARCKGNRLRVIDSKDPKRDEHFKYVWEQGALYTELSSTAQPLLLPYDENVVIDYIKSLNSSTTYKIDCSSGLYACSFTFLIQALRPEVKLWIEAGIDHLFRMIHWHLYPNTTRWNEFYLLTGTNVRVVKPPEDYDRFIRENLAIPAVFGNERVAYKEEWAKCFDSIAEIFNRTIKPKYKKISDYLYPDEN